MKKIRYILIIGLLLLLIANFSKFLPFQYSRIFLFLLIGISSALTSAEEYNRHHDNTAKFGAVLAIFYFVTAVINFFRLF